MRFEFLETVYEFSDATENMVVSGLEAAAKLNLSAHDVQRIISYLHQEDLVRRKSLRNDISITHNGIKAVEDVYNFPDRQSDMFPLLPKTEGQMLPFSDDYQILENKEGRLHTILEIVKDIKNAHLVELLEPEQKSELESDLLTIYVQSRSPKPKWDVCENCLISINRIISEGLVPTADISRITDKIQHAVH